MVQVALQQLILVLPHDVEIINPDLVIANLTQAGVLNMKIRVRRGRGYEPVSVRKLNSET